MLARDEDPKRNTDYVQKSRVKRLSVKESRKSGTDKKGSSDRPDIDYPSFDRQVDDFEESKYEDSRQPSRSFVVGGRPNMEAIAQRMTDMSDDQFCHLQQERESDINLLSSVSYSR